jgi:poly(3-hydroxybutyrate) depolymerase
MGAVVGALALGLSALVLNPTTAAAGGPEVVSDSYERQTVECGYPIDITGEVTSTAMSRTRSPKDPTVFFDHERFSFREVWTNPDTGAWFVIRGESLWADLTATQVDENVYEYSSIRAGQSFVVEDSTGRVVDRDRGVLRFRLLFDTGGDEDPADEFVDILGLDLGGPHPSFETDNCRYAKDLIGISTSSQRYSLHPAGSTGSPLGYAAYTPPSYGQGLSPLLVFVHGAGESGDGSADALARLALQAIPRYIANDGWPDSRPFVVLAPQHDDTAQESDYEHCFDVAFPASCFLTTQHELGNPTPGSPCATPDEVRDFIAYAVNAYNVDPARVYLTGLSCGGYGTWEYLATYGDAQVAAAVPIAGEGRPAWQTAGCGLATVPIWAFHGALDEEVDPNGSIVPVTSLRNECGAADEQAGLTVYPDRDHDSWNITYALGAPVDIYTWLLDHTSP